MYWFRLLFLLTSFGFACSSVLPTSAVLRLLLTGVFFAFDTLVVSVWAPFEQRYRNALSAATSAFGVLQCEILLALVQLGVSRAEDSGGGNVNLGYSQQAVAQSEDPSSELTGQTDFAGWCAVYLALAIAVDAIILAAVYRRVVLRACRRTAGRISACGSWLAVLVHPLIGCVRSVLCSRSTSSVESADPQRYRRESVVDVIKTRILMVRTFGSRRGSQPQLTLNTQHTSPQQPLDRETGNSQLQAAAAVSTDGSGDQPISRVAPAGQQPRPLLPPLRRVGGASRVNGPNAVDVSEERASGRSVAAEEAGSVDVDDAAQAEGKVTAAPSPNSASNFRLIRLPVLLNPHLSAPHSTSTSTSATPRTPRTPLTSRSVKRQARLSRRHLPAFAATASSLSHSANTAQPPASALHLLHTPTPAS